MEALKKLKVRILSGNFIGVSSFDSSVGRNIKTCLDSVTTENLRLFSEVISKLERTYGGLHNKFLLLVDEIFVITSPMEKAES